MRGARFLFLGRCCVWRSRGWPQFAFHWPSTRQPSSKTTNTACPPAFVRRQHGFLLWLGTLASRFSPAIKTGILLRKDWHSGAIGALIFLKGANAPGDPAPPGHGLRRGRGTAADIAALAKGDPRE